MSSPARILAVTGGVGGAKLALGLAKCLPPEQLAFLVNTGDDFEHLGFHISPDVDTLLYTLSAEANPDTGWGRKGETWQFMAALGELGGETWFNLGDRDLITHATRRERLRSGATLSAATQELAQQLGIEHPVFPMSDQPVATKVTTAGGELAFQHYFVRDRCEPAVTGFRFDGIDAAQPNPALAAWLDNAPITGIVFCPSNPYVSIDPILKIPGMTELLRAQRVPIVIVSPIVAGLAIKGPTAKMMAELKLPQTATQVAHHYRDLADIFVLDDSDAALAPAVADLGLDAVTAPTVMVTLEDRIALARAVLGWLGHESEA